MRVKIQVERGLYVIAKIENLFAEHFRAGVRCSFEINEAVRGEGWHKVNLAFDSDRSVDALEVGDNGDLCGPFR